MLMRLGGAELQGQVILGSLMGSWGLAGRGEGYSAEEEEDNKRMDVVRAAAQELRWQGKGTLGVESHVALHPPGLSCLLVARSTAKFST